MVMKHFSREHPPIQKEKQVEKNLRNNTKSLEDIRCEEEILEAFGQ